MWFTRVNQKQQQVHIRDSIVNGCCSVNCPGCRPLTTTPPLLLSWTRVGHHRYEYHDFPSSLWLPETVSIDTFFPRSLCSSCHAFYSHSLGSVGPTTTFGQTGRSSEKRRSAETCGGPGPPGTTRPPCCSRPAAGISQGKGLRGFLMIKVEGPAASLELSRADRLSMRGRTAQI